MQGYTFMIGGKSILAIIPARGGSKGIPRKNIRDLAGKPLIAWTIEEAKKSKYIDRTIISSDDDEIMEFAKKWGGDVPFKRPAELARDESPGIDAILHAIEQFPQYAYIMMLQATSPFRKVEDIDGCLEHFIKSNSQACVSVVEAEQNPYWMYFLDEENKMMPILETKENLYQRQKLPKVYLLNGAVYVATREFVLENKTFVTKETVGYEMVREHSIDIDNEDDFQYVEKILKRMCGAEDIEKSI